MSNEIGVQGTFMELEAQRNVALTNCANKAATIAVMTHKIDALEKEIKTLSKKSKPKKGKKVKNPKKDNLNEKGA